MSSVETVSGASGRVLHLVVSPPRSVEENLVEDERRTREAADTGDLTLRLWWGDAPAVVLGSSEKVEQVVNEDACRRLGVTIVKRPSGGGTVLQTPDVLNYSLTAPAPSMPDIRAVFALGGRLLAGALAQLGLEACLRGTSDVAVGDHKVSGNAMARRWGGLLLHGTLLYDIDMEMVDACLRHPPREPDYRQGRGHREFVTTLRSLGVEVTHAELETAVLDSARRLMEERALDGFPPLLGKTAPAR